MYVCMYSCDCHTIYLSTFYSRDVAETAPTIRNEDNGGPDKPVYLPLNGRQRQPHLHEHITNVFVEVGLRKQAYSNILKILPPKYDNFQIKILIFFHISAQNMDRGYSLEPPWWGGSYEYPQSMFLSRNEKNNLYPCKPHCIIVGFKGVKII